jgi:nicotinamide riboside kinase
MSATGRPLRVVFTGPESTGKTWLASRLAPELGVPWSPEAARLLVEERGTALTAADIDRVARRQIELEQAAVASAVASGAPLVLHDTDLLSTVVYGRYYNGSCPSWIEAAAAARRADLYLLLLPDVPFAAEPGQRGSAADRDAQLPLFRAVLAEAGAAPLEVGGGWPAREDLARRTLRARLRRSA